MFQLSILSPVGEVFNDNVEEVTLPTDKGEVTILSNHVPLFSKLVEGVAIINKGGKQNSIAIVGGFLEVKNNIVTVLSDYAIRAEDIQTARALEAKKRAENFLSNKQSTADLIMAEKELQRSLLELKVADKMKRH
jgi:F-type H+-transporting ATPase subunit epsilon